MNESIKRLERIKRLKEIDPDFKLAAIPLPEVREVAPSAGHHLAGNIFVGIAEKDIRAGQPIFERDIIARGPVLTWDLPLNALKYREDKERERQGYR